MIPVLADRSGRIFPDIDIFVEALFALGANRGRVASKEELLSIALTAIGAGKSHDFAPQ
jgi:hypothetical protein